MVREEFIKLGGAILLLLGIGFFGVGFLSASKSMQATGFMAGIVAIVLIYYAWAVQNNRPPAEEPEEKMPIAKQ